MSEHAVLLHLPTPAPDDEEYFDRVEDALIAEIGAAAVGRFDGIERDLRTGAIVMYMYGPDADRLADVVHLVLQRHPGPPGIRLTKRYGEPGAHEHFINFDY